VLVGHIIHTKVPLVMHDTLKQEVKDTKAHNKMFADATENMDSKVGRYCTIIRKLQQEIKTALKQ
jgi:hypothetical protein